jgi:hypothetical protein
MSARGQRFDFEGNQLTVREIGAIVTCVSDTAIRNHLKAGRNTREAMTRYDHRPKQLAGSKKGKLTTQQRMWRASGLRGTQS